MAKARISLGREDRERLGAPEWVEIDLDDVTIDESIQIEETLGLDFIGFVQGWPGKPRTFKAMVWLGLRRAGIEVPLAELTFKSYDWNRHAATDEASPGKADPEAEADTPSTLPPDSEPS